MSNARTSNSLCRVCQPITVARLRDNIVRHHESLLALKQSAEAGCSFCLLLWRCLKESCHSGAIAAHLAGTTWGAERLVDASVKLRGEFHDTGEQLSEYAPENKIHVWDYQDDLVGFVPVGGFLNVFADIGKAPVLQW